jgi:predicted ferric reductase
MVLAPAVAAKMIPWAIGRSLGLAALIELWALVLVGLWLKSPYSRRYHVVPPALLLRLHQALTSSGAVVLALHIVALLLDRYAGVGVLGALIPGLSGYRRLGVAFGTIALYLGIFIGASAALSGAFVGRRWLTIHRLAIAMFVTAWLHGLTSGTDSLTLQPLYGFFGLTIGIFYVLSHQREQ